MRKLLALGTVLLLVGCGEVPAEEVEPYPTQDWKSEQVEVNNSFEVVVADTPDGHAVTCVITGEGGISCDWDNAVVKVAE